MINYEESLKTVFHHTNNETREMMEMDLEMTVDEIHSPTPTSLSCIKIEPEDNIKIEPEDNISTIYNTDSNSYDESFTKNGEYKNSIIDMVDIKTEPGFRIKEEIKDLSLKSTFTDDSLNLIKSDHNYSMNSSLKSTDINEQETMSISESTFFQPLNDESNNINNYHTIPERVTWGPDSSSVVYVVGYGRLGQQNTNYKADETPNRFEQCVKGKLTNHKRSDASFQDLNAEKYNLEKINNKKKDSDINLKSSNFKIEDGILTLFVNGEFLVRPPQSCRSNDYDLFYALTFCLEGEKSASYYRSKICGKIIRHWNRWRTRAVVYHNFLQAKSFISGASCDDSEIRLYKKYMIENTQRASFCEVIAAARYLKCNINVWLKLSSISYTDIPVNHDSKNNETIHLLLSNGKFSPLISKKNYKCDKCIKTFSVRWLRDLHYKIHTGEKPYECNVCDKAFAHKVSLNEHTLVHTGAKPYKCDVCGKGFGREYYMLKHRSRIHTGKKSYECDLCEKSFHRKKPMFEHRITHTGKNMYECDLCEESFNQTRALLSHRNSHKKLNETVQKTGKKNIS